MGLMMRCPLTGISCGKPITTQEKTFFLAEAEEPQYDRKHRRQAINEAIADGYKIRSALDEKGINAFTCKICEMIQTCAYGIADITQNNANVLLELGMMLALGKPTIILSKKGQERQLKLPSDVIAIEIIPFEEYIDIIDQLRKVANKLPPPVSPPNPIEDLEKLQPQLAEELRKIQADVVKEFKESIEEAKLDTISLREEKPEVPSELIERIGKLEEKLEDMVKLGFTTDANTASLRAYYFYNRGKYEEALASLNWSLELEPDDPTNLTNRGLTYNQLERYEEAFADYNRSLELSPDDPTTFNNRGHTYFRLERYDEALADFNRSLELRRDNPNTIHNRGTVYIKLGKYNEAFADLNHTLELKPDDASTFYNLACLFSLWKKIDDALAYLEKAIKGDKKWRDDAKTDEDFDNIRDDPRFKKLIESD